MTTDDKGFGSVSCWPHAFSGTLLCHTQKLSLAQNFSVDGTKPWFVSCIMRTWALSIYLSRVVDRSLSRSLSKTQHGCILLNFGARKNFKNLNSLKKIQFMSVFFIFALRWTVFELLSKTRFFRWNVGLLGLNFSLEGLSFKERIAFLTITQKRFIWELKWRKQT